MIDSPRDSRSPLLWFAAALLLTGISAGPVSVRFPLWVDEIYSLATAELSPAAMLGALFRVREGWYDQPPMYFMLLRAMLPFGDSPFIVRLPSMFFCAAALALWAANLHRRGFSPLIVLVWMVSMAWHPEFRFHSTNVRMYSLVLLETAAAFWMAERILTSPHPRRAFAVALAIAQAALLYTSYFGAYFVGGIILAGLLLAFKGRDEAERRGGKWILLATAAALVAYLPWAPAALRVAGLTRRVVVITLEQRLQEIVKLIVTMAGTSLVLPLMSVGWLGLAAAPKNDRRLWLGALFLLVVVPTAVLLAMLPESKDLQPRYLVFAAPILSAASLVGWHALLQRAPIPRQARTPLLAALLLGFAISGRIDARRTYLRPIPDWPGAAEIIERYAYPYEIILTGGYLSGECLIYHLKEPNNFSFRHYVTRLAEFEKWCSNPSVVWYVNAAPLPEPYLQVILRNFSHGVEFQGNRGLTNILVFSKRPFIVPWQPDADIRVRPTPVAPAGP